MTDGQLGRLFLISNPHLRPNTRFLLLSVSCLFVPVLQPPGLESEICNCCWTSSAQLFSSPHSCGTHDNILLLIFNSHPIWRDRSQCVYLPGTVWLSYNPKHWGSLSPHPMDHVARVEVFESASKFKIKYFFIIT